MTLTTGRKYATEHGISGLILLHEFMARLKREKPGPRGLTWLRRPSALKDSQVFFFLFCLKTAYFSIENH